jgi:Rrf2 family protein
VYFVVTSLFRSELMRISAKAEYACVAMLELARWPEAAQPVRIKSIADATGIPLRFLVQILLQLKTAGLVSSVRGAAGGYQLSRSPEVISLADIINAIDDQARVPTSALDATRRPSIRRSREAPTKVAPSPVVEALLGVWREIQAEEQRLLERMTMAELLRRTQTNDLMYQI